ncbi:FxsA family protein [Thalassospira marina]|uniref:Exclusion suppressor FxsA n=1 Tax=Thalassospira marina TaxID=2048283 RepID=A0A2N3KVT7_9PROT|nr:FxsA family protein [Thalassospira marina]AUG54681.1 exclusion suppressor FxsA [Thalassospira marina]PKR54689.1 exclusion suppressor FxsA [Thalassospira marina]
MGFILFGIFVVMPIVEIAVFIQAGELIGLWPTIAIVILTAILGTSIMRVQGLQTLARAQQELDRGEMPLGPLFDGVCILIAGILLLTPGFVTDTMGFLLLIPPLRRVIGAGVILKLMKSGKMRMSFGANSRQSSYRPGGNPFGTGSTSSGGQRRGSSGPIIDGDYEDLDQRNGNAGGTPPDQDDQNRNLPPRD